MVDFSARLGSPGRFSFVDANQPENTTQGIQMSDAITSLRTAFASFPQGNGKTIGPRDR